MKYESPMVVEVGMADELVQGHTPINCEFHGECRVEGDEHWDD